MVVGREAAALAAEARAFALVSEAVGLSPGVAVSAAEPGVLALAFVVVGPEAVSGAAVSLLDAAALQVSADIALASDVSAPVSAFAVEVDSSGPPNSPAFPNVDHSASSSSSVEGSGKESVHSSTGARANHGSGSILSNQGLYQNTLVQNRF